MPSPTVAGVFAHESFGHKSESDFMLGSETMRREWELGKQVGWEGLSILDSGVPNGSGYCPYDDEGTRARDTYLVKNGVLTAACIPQRRPLRWTRRSRATPAPSASSSSRSCA